MDGVAGSDANGGSLNAPLATIPPAFGRIAPGGTIWVKEATYTVWPTEPQFTQVMSSGALTTLRAYDPSHRPTIVVPSQIDWSYAASPNHWRIDGFIFDFSAVIEHGWSIHNTGGTHLEWANITFRHLGLARVGRSDETSNWGSVLSIGNSVGDLVFTNITAENCGCFTHDHVFYIIGYGGKILIDGVTYTPNTDPGAGGCGEVVKVWSANSTMTVVVKNANIDGAQRSGLYCEIGTVSFYDNLVKNCVKFGIEINHNDVVIAVPGVPDADFKGIVRNTIQGCATGIGVNVGVDCSIYLGTINDGANPNANTISGSIIADTDIVTPDKVTWITS